MNNSSSAGKTSMVGVYILSLISVILWGMSYLWSDKLLSLGLPVEYVVFIRIFIASFLLLGYNLVKKYHIAISKKDLPKFLLLSLFEPFIYFVAETYGIKYTESPTISALIIASTPIFFSDSGRVDFQGAFQPDEHVRYSDMPRRYRDGYALYRIDYRRRIHPRNRPVACGGVR